MPEPRSGPPESGALVRCLVVDDNDFARQSIVLLLTHSGLAVRHACATAREAVGWFRPGAVEVAVLDLDLGPGPSGVDLAAGLRRSQPDLGIVLLTVCSDPRLLGVDPSEIPLGTRYVVKDSLHDAGRLRTAVVSAAVRQAAVVPRGADFAVPRTDFGDAQIGVLRLVAEGCTNSEIARRRGVTVEAVERAITRLNHQLGITAGNQVSARVMLANVYWAMVGRREAVRPALPGVREQ